MNMQYEPLTLQRAQAIVEHAENEYATGRRFHHTFTPFEAGGASSPQEALLSLYIVIAQRFSSVCQSGSSAALKMFDDYVASSRLISIDLFLESTEIESTAASLTPETIARLKALVTLDSFVSFLRTLRKSSPDYWPQVYERLGLAWPVPSASIQVETSVETKPWECNRRSGGRDQRAMAGLGM